MSYAPIRRGIVKHLVEGRMNLSEFSAYTLMILLADHQTGVWHGSAKGLEFVCGISYRRARHILEGLEDRGYIKRFSVQGKHGNYPILINKYEITSGNEVMRVNIANTTNWESPSLDRVNGDVNDDVKVNVKAESPSQELIKHKKQKNKPMVWRQDARFMRLLSEYPRGNRKHEAYLEFKKINPDDDEFEAIIRSIRKYRDTPTWNKDGMQYVPQLRNFLKNRTYEDFEEEFNDIRSASGKGTTGLFDDGPGPVDSSRGV